ncbi:MAG: 16S rRNA (uracil(1498)-N(3))-methyltransferase [Phycisphaerae bacterium]
MKDKGRQYRLYAPVLAGAAADAPGRQGALVPLPEGEVHHAWTVLRLKDGERVEVFDGTGLSAHGTLIGAGRRGLSVRIERLNPPAQRRGPAVHLAFAVPKGNRLDWLLEKATELGAASLRPVIFERSVAGGGELSDAKRQRWLGHCVSAAKQCGLDFLPEIIPPAGLRVFLAGLPAAAVPSAAASVVRIVGDGSPRTPPLASVLAGRRAREVCILVGPEGGLSEDEAAEVWQAGFAPARVGWTTLRIETAAIAMLAGAMAILDDDSSVAAADS